MKLILIGLLLIQYAEIFAACNKNVDQKKAVVFIDTNFSLQEAIAAKEAACARGESFILLPYGEKLMKQGWEISKKMGPIEDQLLKMSFILNQSQAQRNKEILLRYKLRALQDELKGLIRIKPPLPLSVKAGLKSLADDNIAITSVAISGHDGGGAIHGSIGTIDKQDFISSFKDAYAGKPQLEGKLREMLLWGCYTTTPGEVLNWQEQLPGLKIIAGFYDKGPKNNVPASSKLMKDLLVKASDILKKVDEKKLLEKIKGLSGLSSTFAGISVKLDCNEEYYYSRNVEADKEGGKKVLKETFGKIDLSCESAGVRKMLSEMSQVQLAYFQGGRPIPEDTGRSELRNLYSKARHLSHCIPPGHDLDPNRLGLLLFYSGVKNNFFKVFSQEVAEAEAELNSFAQWAPSIGLEPDYLDEVKRAFFTVETLDWKQIISDRGRLKTLSSKLTRITNELLTREGTKNSERTKNLVSFSSKLEKYLYRLDPSCMNFLDWHEAKEGHMPTPRCE